jgi:uncharacterized membrane protein YbhN (UPF0104 family)
MLSRLYELMKSFLDRLLLLTKKVNRWVVLVILVAVTLIILGLLVYRQWDVIINYHWQFKPIPIALSFLLYSALLVWVAVIWGWLINSLGPHLSYQKHIRYYILSNIAKRIPGTIWYVASRVQLYVSDGLEIKITTVASAVEMVLVYLAGILVVLASATQTLARYHISPFILVAIFFLGLILIHPRVLNWILNRRKIEYRALSYGRILLGIGGYVIVWIFGGLILFEIGNIIYPISTYNLLYFVTTWALIGIISILFFFSPSSFGITEIGLSLLLSNIVPSSIAVLIAIAARILLMAYDILWAGVFLLFNQANKALLTRKD